MLPPNGDLANECIFIAEMLVELALACTGLTQDLLQTGTIDALSVEELSCRLDNALSSGFALSITAVALLIIE
ncbi:hypothetical protein HME01_32600 [Vreelandella aquamarina]|nr:hypothetical protein HME01_32600 [Halomonas meridiana]